MKILALDGSTKSTGWAVFDGIKLIDYGCITATSTDLVKRIYKMIDGLKEVITKHPDIQKVILEEVRPEQGALSIKTHKALMYLQAAIVFMFHDADTKSEIIYVYPNSWRKACGIKTGSGVKRNTLKQKDIEFVKDTYGLDVNDDIADAICIGHAQAWSERTSNWG